MLGIFIGITSSGRSQSTESRTGLDTIRSVEDHIREASSRKAFVIVASVRSYDVALLVAKRATARLGFRLDLRELVHDREYGLTWPREVCAEEGAGGDAGYPCYVPRGRWDDGRYVSIESSGAYPGFKEGYFIVVAASGEPDSELVASGLESAKQVFPTAYVRTASVYMGCMH